MANPIDPLFRSRRYKSVAGVCSGLALSRGYSICLTRIITLLLISISGIGLIAYLLGWALIPVAPQGSEPEALRDPLRRDTKKSILGGVCAGLAKSFDWDTALVRVVWALLVLTGGIGVLPYFYAWIAVPKTE